MKHAVEIVLTLSATFKASADQQSIDAKTEISLSLDMTTYFHKSRPEGPRCVCSMLCVCTLDGLNAEHKFRVCVNRMSLYGRMSHHFHCTVNY